MSSAPFPDVAKSLKYLLKQLYDMRGDAPCERLAEVAKHALALLDPAAGVPLDDELDPFKFDFFRALPSEERRPIVDVQVVFPAKEKDAPAAGYTVLRKSVEGHKADVNRGSGGRLVFLAVRRSAFAPAEFGAAADDVSAASAPLSSAGGGSAAAASAAAASDVEREPAPITSLSVVFRDLHEEPPLGFEAVEKSATGAFEANLNSGSSGGRRVALALRRGAGPAITDVGVMLAERKEQLPPGYHKVQHTPFGNVADLNSGTDGAPIFLVYRLDISPVLERYYRPRASPAEEAYGRCLACLTAALYTSDQKLVLESFSAFRKLSPSAMPRAALNAYIHALCDAVGTFLAFFDTRGHRKVLKFLWGIYRSQLASLDVQTCVHILECCVELRHEDKKDKVSRHMLNNLINNIPACKRHCACVSRRRHQRRDLKVSTARAADDAAYAAEPNSGGGLTAPLRPGGHRRGLSAASPRPSPAAGGAAAAAHRRNESEMTNASALSFGSNSSDDEDGGRGRGRGGKAAAAAAGGEAETPERGAAGDPAAYRCIKCQQRARAHGMGTEEFCREMAMSMVRNVSLVKSLEANVRRFQRHQGVTPAFRADVAELVEEHYEDHRERVYVAFLLTLCKFATESAPFNLKKSELVKRKAHSLQLLLHVLKHSGDFFTGGGVGSAPALPITASELILRRYIASSLVECCVTDVPTIFRVVLQLFVLLWSKYRDQLMIELGVIMDHIFIGLLDSSSCTTEQKKDIVDVFLRVLSEPEALINIFYNYDNDVKSWSIYEKLVKVLSDIIEGDLVSAADPVVAAPGSGDVGGGSGGGGGGGGGGGAASHPPRPPATPGGGEDDPGDTALRKRALRLLANIMYTLAEWTRVPLQILRPRAATGDDSGPRDDSSLKVSSWHRRARSSMTGRDGGGPVATWHVRRTKQLEEKEEHDKVIQIAERSGIKAALKYLRASQKANLLPHVLAQFLYKNERLDKREVGDILGNEADSLMPSAGYEQLRECYLKLLDFTGMSFDAALRMFLCDSGFRLPGESQKVDRLLDVFAKAYGRDNPGVFSGEDSAYIVSFALVMLNTDAHDPRLKATKRTMTLQQFVSNLRGVNDGADFPLPFLTQLYNSVTTNAIEWKADTDQLAREREEAGGGKDGKDGAPAAGEREFRKNYELLARRGQAHLRNLAAVQRSYLTTTSVEIVTAIYDVSWHNFAGAISTLVDNTRHVDVLQVCLDALLYGACTAMLLPDSYQYWESFTRVLAKLRFMESHRDDPRVQDRIMAGEHLEEAWNRVLKAQVKAAPLEACRSVAAIVAETKLRISYERHQELLKRIQAEFGGDIVLQSPGRVFVKSAVMTKLSHSGRRRILYNFFLFNDLLIYASEGLQTKFKVHRVIHLSLVQLIDLQSPGAAGNDGGGGGATTPQSSGNLSASSSALSSMVATTAPAAPAEPCFILVSPQKTIKVMAQSQKEKDVWVALIEKHSSKVRERRGKYLEQAAGRGVSRPGSAAVGGGGRGGRGGDGSDSDDDGSSGDEEDSRSGGSDDEEGDAAPVAVKAPDGLSDDVRRRISSFVALSGEKYGDEASVAASRKRQHCMLCIRPYSGVFRRRTACAFCKESVCSDCATHKHAIPGVAAFKPQKVCDACYGVLSGLVTLDQPVRLNRPA